MGIGDALTGAFSGLSAGLSETNTQMTNAMNVLLQQDRNDSLGDRNAIDAGSLAQRMKEYEDERVSRKLADDKVKAETEKIVSDNKDKGDIRPFDEFVSESSGGLDVPMFIKGMKEVATRSGVVLRNGETSAADYKDFTRRLHSSDPKDRIEGGLQMVLDEAVMPARKQLYDRRAAMEREIQKLIEKDPYLAENPEAAEMNPKLKELKTGIEALTEAYGFFNAQVNPMREKIEADKAEIEFLDRQKRMIETQQRARDAGGGGSAFREKVNALKSIGISEDAAIADQTGFSRTSTDDQKQIIMGLRSERRSLLTSKTQFATSDVKEEIDTRIKEIDNTLAEISKMGGLPQELQVLLPQVNKGSSQKSDRTLIKLSDGTVAEKLMINGVSIYKDKNGNDIDINENQIIETRSLSR